MTMSASSATVITDYSSFSRPLHNGRHDLHLVVGGMHCAGCAFKIEKKLRASDGVEARVNVTEKRLYLSWAGGAAAANDLLAGVRGMGFELSPVSAAVEARNGALKTLLRYVAVAGFASGNIMIFSLVLWFSDRAALADGTRDMFHWLSGLLAMPAIAYAGQPFFGSAWRALSQGRTNMDVPIAVALTLATGVSLFETISHGAHVYFDSAAMLLFFLLVGRYLDARARMHTRHAASDLLALMQGEATVVQPNGGLKRRPAAALQPGDVVLVAHGEKIMADGRAEAALLADASALNGESLPRTVLGSEAVLAGMVNVGDAVRMVVEKTQGDSLMADIVDLMHKAEQGNARYVQVADRVSRWYTPVVHVLAAITFVAWWQWGGLPWQAAMMYGAAVLIITCPCALALAVPVSQVIASSVLFRQGLLVRNADAFERLGGIDTIVFDKTGTLTSGAMTLTGDRAVHLRAAPFLVAVTAHSRHPLSQAVVAAFPDVQPCASVTDIHEAAGEGITGMANGQRVVIGTAAFTGAAVLENETSVTLWYRIGNDTPQCLVFTDTLYPDAIQTVRELSRRYRIILLSGDRDEVTGPIAGQLGVDTFVAGVDPRRKYEMIVAEEAAGHRVLMVGDGVNDAAALSAASASLSPGSATAIAQNAADIVYQRSGVAPVAQALSTAARLQRVIRQNFTMALFYNVFAIPLAMAGFVTPLVAAAAMSSSSLLVIGNALRLRKGHGA